MVNETSPNSPADRGAHRTRRSPGERAFDRVLGSMLAYFVVVTFLGVAGVAVTDSESPPPPLLKQIEFGCGLAGAVLWLWLLRGVVLAWRDSLARVLRFSSCVLLFFGATSVPSLLFD